MDQEEKVRFVENDNMYFYNIVTKRYLHYSPWIMRPSLPGVDGIYSGRGRHVVVGEEVGTSNSCFFVAAAISSERKKVKVTNRPQTLRRVNNDIFG